MVLCYQGEEFLQDILIDCLFSLVENKDQEIVFSVSKKLLNFENTNFLKNPMYLEKILLLCRFNKLEVRINSFLNVKFMLDKTQCNNLHFSGFYRRNSATWISII